MRRLLVGLIIIMIVGQLPQVSAEFKEEKEGIDAAYQKAARAYDLASHTYSRVQNDVETIRTSLSETKKDIDKGVGYTEKMLTAVSKYTGMLRVLVDDVKLP